MDESRVRYPLRRDPATGLWVWPDPDRCPAGHVLADVGFQRGWYSCWCWPRGHKTWRCGQCDDVLLDPSCENPDWRDRMPKLGRT